MSTGTTRQGVALSHDLAFAYRLYPPRGHGDAVMILLHGSGVDETTMAPLGAEIAPDALRIAVRGRIPQQDGWRWFARITPTSFEQRSLRDEVAAFAAFVGELGNAHGFDPGRAILLGYSNGANVVSSLALLHPGIVQRAILLRAMPVLDASPPTDLTGADMLVISGAGDVTYAPFAPALVALLRAHGARVEERTVSSGHGFGPHDVAIARKWLARSSPPPVS
jgi:phospholipase/carboxylesterase